ncbi:MAG: YqgE/AlgH family protein [Methylococcales bacterium]|nr:YqgE/AlgH family protein [Methylococcales bacterium]
MEHQSGYLSDQLLIAMPGLSDPSFFHTVTYLCQHNADGALGIVVNRQTDMTLGDILKQMDIAPELPGIEKTPIFHGGPVQPERGFVLHNPAGQWLSTLIISDQIALTTSRDILEAIAKGEGPQHFLIALGYAGWGEGQLEKEITENAWLNIPSGQEILFKTPVNQRWQDAAKNLGIDIKRLTAPAGHG